MTQNAPVLIVVACAAILTAALGFQYLGGLPPCPMCHWQRYAYVAAGVLALAAFAGWRRVFLALAGLALLAGAGIAAYHAGIEWKLFEGPAACTGTVTGSTVEELRQRLTVAPVVRCDEPAWTLFGVSLAGYNALIGAALGAYALFAAWRARP